MRRLLAACFAASLVCVLVAADAPRARAEAAKPAVEMTTPQLVRSVRSSVVRVELEGAALEPVIPAKAPNVSGEKELRYKIVFGTGFVIDDAGHVVTNNHVIHPADVKWQGTPKLTVELPKDFDPRPASFHNKAEEEAYKKVEVRNGRCFVPVPVVVGSDEASDLAVLQIPAALLKPLKFARPESIEVGQDVVAIGFAHGLAGLPTVTKGVVSATGRSLAAPDPEVADLIQTDAAINHGNSGGPLLNLFGEVVGVNTYTLAGPQDVSTQGMYLARSSRTAEPYVAALIRDGRVTRASLGVKTAFLGRADAKARDIAEGVVVTGVERDSAAADAGLKVGDMIVRIGDNEIHSVGDLKDALATLKKGQTVEVEYRNYEVTLADPPKEESVFSSLARGFQMGTERSAAAKTVKVTLK